MYMTANGKQRPHLAQYLTQGNAPDGLASAQAVTVRMRRRVRDDDVGVQWNLPPERTSVGRLVSECPIPRELGVGRAKDFKYGLGAVGPGQAD